MGWVRRLFVTPNLKFLLEKKKRINLSKRGAGIGKWTFVTPTVHELNPWPKIGVKTCPLISFLKKQKVFKKVWTLIRSFIYFFFLSPSWFDWFVLGLCQDG